MDALIILLGAVLIVVIGRNDGTPLVAIALRGLPINHWWIAIIVLAVLPAAPLLGFYLVAQALFGLFPQEGGDYAVVLAILAGTILTILVSMTLRAPNSITLALVGGAAGASLGAGIAPQWQHVGFVLMMAAAAPVIGCLVAAAVPYGVLHPSSPKLAKVFSIGKMRWPALVAIIVSYSLNDGQKLVFIIAIIFAVPVGEAAGSVTANGVVLVLFVLGMLSGLRSSMSMLAHGVLRTTPISAVWAQISTSLTLVAGSALGSPMSMTQTLQGSLLGSGLKRGTRIIRWMSVWRILLAWVWTLPLSAALAYAIVRITNEVNI